MIWIAEATPARPPADRGYEPVWCDGLPLPGQVGLTALWGAATLTLVTGWDYLRVGLKHMD